MARTPWVLYDPITFASYSFEINPAPAGNAAEIIPTKTTEMATEADTGPIVVMSQDAQLAGTFAGTILSQAEYQALVTWFNKDYVVRLTDDQGRVQNIFFTGFQPQRVRNANIPWRMTYTATYLVYSLVDV